jgi:hypothetical protein
VLNNAGKNMVLHQSLIDEGWFRLLWWYDVVIKQVGYYGYYVMKSKLKKKTKTIDIIFPHTFQSRNNSQL